MCHYHGSVGDSLLKNKDTCTKVSTNGKEEPAMCPVLNLGLCTHHVMSFLALRVAATIHFSVAYEKATTTQLNVWRKMTECFRTLERALPAFLNKGPKGENLRKEVQRVGHWLCKQLTQVPSLASQMVPQPSPAYQKYCIFRPMRLLFNP